MEIKVPEVGESVREALLVKWHKADGAQVARDELLCELETDKITLELHAEADGILAIRVPEGATVAVGSVVATLTTAGSAAETAAAPAKGAAKAPAKKAAAPAAPAAVPTQASPTSPPVAAASAPAPQVHSEEPAVYVARGSDDPRSERRPMTPIRRRIAERLLAARQQTAMLTTFNEADLTRVQELRHRYHEVFEKRHGVRLGLMSFFVKASIEALRAFPEVNARIDGNDIVFQNFYDIGIAIGGDKGLVVPVLRDAERLHFADIERGIAAFAEKVAQNRLTLADLEGGTFTISNGGVYGSLLSTPILNPPQSAVLGLHTIQERPVVRSGQIVVRPMMYLALSYDHRLIDGRQAVGFLKLVKEFIEAPEEMLLEL